MVRSTNRAQGVNLQVAIDPAIEIYADPRALKQILITALKIV
jgi:hypothetical protein